MSKNLLLSVLLFVFISSAQSQNYVTLYEDCNYSGRYFYLEPGNYRLYQMKIDNDRLSCINIPYGFKVTIYENDKFEGASRTYTSSIACLEAEWNDKASSIVVESTTNYPYNQNDYVVFYNDCNSKGFSQTLRPGQYTGSQLGNSKFNISSFTIYGNLRVKAYINNTNLSGLSYSYTNSVNCLTSSQNDKIGSLIIEYAGYGNNNNNYPNNNNYNNNNSFATIYTDCNYRGNSLRLSPGTYQGDKLGLLKYDISSIELPSNLRARVYINNDYLNGNYYTISNSSSCLSNNLNNRIGSLVIEEVYNNNNNNYQPNEYNVVIYTDQDYKGQSVSLLPGMYGTMSQINFPDNALSSLIVPQGYRVVIYEYANFSGKSYTITASKSKFYLSNWNDKTSSIAVYRE